MTKYVNADELLKQLNTCKYPAEKTTMRRVTYNAAISDVCRSVDAMPAADVQEVRHGKWEIEDDMPRLDNTFTIRCSLCGQLMFAHPNDENPNFCCNCGAKMDEVKDE